MTPVVVCVVLTLFCGMENVAVVLALTRIGHVASRFDAVLATMWLDMSVLKESRGRKRRKAETESHRRLEV